MTDSPASTPSDEPALRIGAVCRMTGISQHVIRVWEKRYGAVEPERSDTRRRLYRRRDVERLVRLKTLVDRGQAIGSIAGMDDAELERRIRETAGAPPLSAAAEKPRLALFGESLASAVQAVSGSEVFEPIGHFDDERDFAARHPRRDLDVAVVAVPSLYPDSAIDLTKLANRLSAGLLIVVYDYASQAALRRLPGDRVNALRAPLDAVALDAVVGWRFGRAARPGDAAAAPAPANARRRFDDRQLAFLATLGSAIACECPQHLARLVAGLAGFEDYSAECASRNAEDAALHAYLRETTAGARASMELALARVVEMENLVLPTDD